MDELILKKDSLNDFLSALSADYLLWAPIQKDGDTLFEPFVDCQNTLPDLARQAAIIKHTIFPQTEPLFSFDQNDQIQEPDSADMKQNILFGVRPCDARSFSLLDPVFKGDIPDPYYLARRTSAILIGIACIEPFANCFCTSVGGSPCGQEGLDLLCTDLGDQYLVAVLSEKGKELINKTSALFTKASAEDSTQGQELSQTAERNIKRQIDLAGVADTLSRIFEHPVWKKMTLKCIGCGICTYTCPTCYCFDILDEPMAKRRGRRVRVWDSCMYKEYTLHASGHNPRPTRVERLKNRIYHKFKFNVDTHGAYGCVGCGRCITLCPVNEDIIENLLAVKGAA
jgi:ferredoxin